jgi:hypothetical protein
MSIFLCELKKSYCGSFPAKIKDILKFWEENKLKFPLLFELSCKYLCISATSCASERVFSKAGEIVSAKRSKLKPKHVNNLIFLNKNYPKLNKMN